MEDTKVRKKSQFRLFKLVMLLLLVLLVLVGLIYYPYLYHELRYKLTTADPEANIVLKGDSIDELKGIDFAKPILISSDSKYALIIPKIGANSEVVENIGNIETGNVVTYKSNSPFPSQEGETIIDTHQLDGKLVNTQINPVYFLMNKLNVGDIFYIVYEGDIYKFRIYDIDKTKPDVLSNSIRTQKTITIRSPWPVGFQFRLLNIHGELESIE